MTARFRATLHAMKSGAAPLEWPAPVAGFVVAALALLAFGNAAVAQAEIRESTESDPMDASPTLSGIPNNPDIESATVAYDTAGSIQVTVNFFHPFSSLDTSSNYAFFTHFSIGEGEGQVDYGGEQDCLFAGEAAAREGKYLVAGGLYGSFVDYSFNGSTYPNDFSVEGLQGASNLTVSVTPNGRSVTATGSAPGLANRDYRCFELSLTANTRSTASNLYSTWDGGCGCWAITSYLDTLGVADSGEDRIAAHRVLWFDGFAPQPKAATPPPPPTTTKPQKSECQSARALVTHRRRAFENARRHFRQRRSWSSRKRMEESRRGLREAAQASRHACLKS